MSSKNSYNHHGAQRKSRHRIRKRPVTFGNPALGTYYGTVHTLADPESFDMLLPEETSVQRNMVALVDVPPEQVPEGILSFARHHRRFIDHVRIVITSEQQQQEVNPNEEFKKEDKDDEENSPKIDDHSDLVGDGCEEHDDSKQPSLSVARNGVMPLFFGAKPSLLIEKTALPSQPQPPLSFHEQKHHIGSHAQVPAMENAASILVSDPPIADEFKVSSSQISSDERNQFLSNQTLFLERERANESRTYLILIEFQSDEAANEFVLDLDKMPYSILDETQVASIHRVVGLEGQDGVSLMSPMFAAGPKAPNRPARAMSSASLESRNSQTSTVSTEEIYNCAVCLERMDLDPPKSGTSSVAGSSVFTTVCNHSFHLDCLLKCKDSPCPVCRYDHSGLNEVLSQCHVCGVTRHNFVCLICGVVSCGGSGTYSSAPGGAVAVASLDGDASVNHDDITACSVNGQLRSVPPTPSLMAHGHAQQHYDETLHAYALNTETQHVWDFAGQGYVHRLLQNTPDGKLVEVHDPNSRSAERTLSPGLSDSQEGEVVHRKLEGFASQYYTLLKSQLEQQRVFYEGKLEEVRQEYGRQAKSKSGDDRSAELITAMKHERSQLSHRLMTLRKRYDKVAEDVSFLKNMNESLEANMEQIKRHIRDAQRERAETREIFQRRLPPLEEKVRKLILQLEQGLAADDENR